MTCPKSLNKLSWQSWDLTPGLPDPSLALTTTPPCRLSRFGVLSSAARLEILQSTLMHIVILENVLILWPVL